MYVSLIFNVIPIVSLYHMMTPSHFLISIKYNLFVASLQYSFPEYIPSMKPITIHPFELHCCCVQPLNNKACRSQYFLASILFSVVDNITFWNPSMLPSRLLSSSKFYIRISKRCIFAVGVFSKFVFFDLTRIVLLFIFVSIRPFCKFYFRKIVYVLTINYKLYFILDSIRAAFFLFLFLIRGVSKLLQMFNSACR